MRYVRLPAGAITGRSEPLYAWALLRHADVLAAIRDPATFSSQSQTVLKMMPKFSLLHDDPPHHTHLRRLVSKAFSPQRIASLSDWIGRIANELLDTAGKGLRGPHVRVRRAPAHARHRRDARRPGLGLPVLQALVGGRRLLHRHPAEERARRPRR